MNPYLVDALISLAVCLLVIGCLVVAAAKLGPRVMAATMRKQMAAKPKAPVAG